MSAKIPPMSTGGAVGALGEAGAGELAACEAGADEPSPLGGEFAAACVAGAVAGEIEGGAATVAGAGAAGVPTA
jgi:hypothetical protein